MEQEQFIDPTIMFFDQFQRYHTAAGIIRRLMPFAGRNPHDRPDACGSRVSGISYGHEAGKNIRILEVGANEHRDLGKELPGADIYYTDLHLPESMTDDDHCFTADATDLKETGDGAYDFCVALDVFEHVPEEKRGRFLTELYRVCKTAAIISFPYNAPEVVQAEREVNEMYRELFGEDHPWLIEHMENGLPDRARAEKTLYENHIRFTAFTHGTIAVWKRMLVLNYFADEDAFGDVVTETNLYYNRNLYDRDTGNGGCGSPKQSGNANETDYRAFYILEKAGDIAGKLQNPFLGKRLTDADIAPVDAALNRIIQ